MKSHCCQTAECNISLITPDKTVVLVCLIIKVYGLWVLGLYSARRKCAVWLLQSCRKWEQKVFVCLWLNLSDAEGRRYWEVGARATEGGMLSCFNLCQCPSVWRWCEFRAQCVPLYLAIDPADRSCRRPSEGLGFSFKCVCVCVCVESVRPYQCCGHPPFALSEWPP